MIAVGIDYSLTSPCVCVARDTIYENSYFHFLNDRKSTMGVFENVMGDGHDDYLIDQQRYENIANWVINIIAPLDPTDLHIMIEDYSFGSKGKVFHIAENCGTLKFLLYKNNYKFHTVPPTVVKKFATGKGNATKDSMYETFQQETGKDLIKVLTPKCKLGSPVTDVVDAWYLAKYMIANLKA